MALRADAWDLPAHTDQQIIARCTRDGVTSWRSVALQLGCSVYAARRRLDPDYAHVRPWPYPCQPMTPEGEVFDLNDTSSLAPKGPGMRIEIVCLLKRQGPLPVRSIAGRLGKPCNSVRMRLSRMRDDGWVQNDSLGRGNGKGEWTWRLTELGAQVASEGGAALHGASGPS